MLGNKNKTARMLTKVIPVTISHPLEKYRSKIISRNETPEVNNNLYLNIKEKIFLTN